MDVDVAVCEGVRSKNKEVKEKVGQAGKGEKERESKYECRLITEPGGPRRYTKSEHG